MKTRPIIFNGEMVCAILDGHKTRTRRVVEPQPTTYDRMHRFNQFIKWRDLIDAKDFAALRFMEPYCPYGVPGDRLWVRETWFPMQDIKACAAEGEPIDVVYKADWDADGISRDEAKDAGIDRWHSPIFMFRWASRITLEITGVRVERVQDITEDDVIAEGCGLASWGPDPYTGGPMGPQTAGFAQLWDSINAKRGCGWDVNPWVWVLEFRRLGGEE